MDNMHVKSMKDAIDAGNRQTGEYLEKRQKMMGSSDVFQSDYIIQSVQKLDQEYSEKIIKNITDFRKHFENTRKYANMNIQNEGRVFSSDSKEDQILFELKKQSFQRDLELMNPQEILSGYESAIASGDNESAQIYEDVAERELRRRGSSLAARMRIFKENNISMRISENTKTMLEQLQCNENLYQASSRIIEKLGKVSPRDWGSSIHVWVGLSNSSLRKTWGAKEIQLALSDIQIPGSM